MPPHARFRALTNRISQSGMYVIRSQHRGIAIFSAYVCSWQKKLSLPAVDMAITLSQKKAVDCTGQFFVWDRQRRQSRPYVVVGHDQKDESQAPRQFGSSTGESVDDRTFHLAPLKPTRTVSKSCAGICTRAPYA